MSAICVILFISIITLSNGVEVPMNPVPSMSSGFIKNNLLELLEELRIRMHMDMTEELGISRLDPFFIEELDFEPIWDEVEFEMTNVQGVGLKQFVVNELDFNLIALSFLFNVTTPTLTLTGDFVTNEIVGGEGLFNIILQNPTIRIVGRLGLTETGSWTMHDLRINFTITRFEGGFQGLTSELLNNLLNFTAPTLLKSAWPDLEPVIIETIYGLLEGAVNSMTIAEFISLLSGNGLDWPDVEEQNHYNLKLEK